MVSHFLASIFLKETGLGIGWRMMTKIWNRVCGDWGSNQQQIRGQLKDVQGPSESGNLETVVVPIAQFGKFS